jgi:predicted PurR-regulated permease PerM
VEVISDMPSNVERTDGGEPADGAARPIVARHHLQWAVFLAAVAIIFYLGYEIVSPFFRVVAWSSVLVIAFSPVHRRLAGTIRRPSLRALASTALAAVTILLPLMFLIALAFPQFLSLSDFLQERFSGGFDLLDLEPLQRVWAWLTGVFRLDPAQAQKGLAQYGSELGRIGVESLGTLLTNVTGGIVSSFFILFAMFLLFRDGKGIVERIPDLLPFERARTEEFLARIRGVVDASVHGVLVIAGIQAALIGLGFSVLRIPYAGLWAAVTLFTSPIPVLGASVVWLPGAIYLLLAGNWVKAVILIAWGGLVVSSIDNVLRPRLVADRVGVGEFFMFFAILGGLRVFGALGIVLGPVVFAAAAYLLEALSGRRSNRVESDS